MPSCSLGSTPLLHFKVKVLINALTVQVKSGQDQMSGYPTNQELAKENWAIGEWAPVHVLAKRATDLACI
jgi:hypothetical protein